MRMTSLLIIAIGVIFIIVASQNTLKYVFTEIKSIGQTTVPGQSQSGTGLTPGCIDAATGRSVPCIAKNSLDQIQQNLVTY